MTGGPWEFPSGFDPNPQFEPNFFGKLNFIAKFIVNPCYAPFSVYVELGAPYFGNIVMGMLLPDPLDIAQNIHQPKTLGGCRRKRRGKRGRARRRGIPNIDDMVADRVREFGGAKQKPISGTKALMFAGAGLIQRAAWQWYVALLTVDNVYQWLSAVQSTEFCQASQFGLATVRGGDYAWLSPPTGLTMPQTGTKQKVGTGTVSISGVGNTAHPQAVQASGTIENAQQYATAITVSMTYVSGGTEIVLDSDFAAVGPYGSMSYGLSGRAPDGVEVRLKLTSTATRVIQRPEMFQSAGIGGLNVKGF